jgi:hypothetical protein
VELVEEDEAMDFANELERRIIAAGLSGGNSSLDA